ncbi:hypothetical protein VKT23_018529 [Stygiomarasmius scandens]|uniref:Uncharacterized protein n=1 Tax=Marasmiellus scandens TaxID=2682957 RepID=A0ABR1IP40_9AGAR
MFFNKSALIAIVTAASVGSVVAQVPTSFIGSAGHFDPNHLPGDFTPCGADCSASPLPRIALPSTLYNGADVCCSTFTITYHGKTVQGTYAYKSSALAGTTNGVLADELFNQLNDQQGANVIFPVQYRL